MTMSSPQACPHERDVLDLVAVGQWPARADAALQAHVAHCACCGEVAAVASAVRDWADAAPAPKVPDAAVVWYRAQVRAREEAARRASRPVLVGQLFALATVVLAVATLGPGWGWFTALVPDWTMPAWSFDLSAMWPSLPTLADLRQWSWFGWAALAAGVTWLIAGSVALVLAARD